jgi:hypothetical protein
MIPKRPARAAPALAVIAALLTAAHAQTSGVASGFRAAAQTALQRLDVAMAQVGLTACAPVFGQAGQFLFENAPVQFVVQPLGPNANRWPTVVTAEGAHPMPGGATQTRLTTLLVAPAGTCSGLYQQVIYWPETCATLKKRVFPTFANDRPLLARVRQSEASPGLQLYLMPAGPTGCVSVKKELIG